MHYEVQCGGGEGMLVSGLFWTVGLLVGRAVGSTAYATELKLGFWVLDDG